MKEVKTNLIRSLTSTANPHSTKPIRSLALNQNTARRERKIGGRKMSKTNTPRPTATNTLGLAPIAVTNPPIDFAAATKNRLGQFMTDMVFQLCTVWPLGCEEINFGLSFALNTI